MLRGFISAHSKLSDLGCVSSFMHLKGDSDYMLGFLGFLNDTVGGLKSQNIQSVRLCGRDELAK